MSAIPTLEVLRVSAVFQCVGDEGKVYPGKGVYCWHRCRDDIVRLSEFEGRELEERIGREGRQAVYTTANMNFSYPSCMSGISSR